VTVSKDNDFMNKRQREYFSVPHGKPGRSTSGPRTGRPPEDPYAGARDAKAQTLKAAAP